MSSIAKFNVKIFDGSNDIGLWRVKMRCLLIQHGWEAGLDPFSKTMTDTNKIAALKMDVYKKAHTDLLLCLDNKVLRKVNKEDSAAGKKLSEHIYKFNKLIGDLANIDVDIDDKDQALMLLTSLPSSYDNFVETLLYGRGCGMHSEGYDNGDLLMAVSKERFLEWIMDSGGSFHMTPRRDFLFEFKEFNGASVGIQEKDSLAQVWHKRMGHISKAGLHELERRDVLGNKGL
nr:retrovirus-related Pol polyprotein from transposon TNT 1-94 [Tanacetum cinerariifolium]